jgi:hypothetical protein
MISHKHKCILVHIPRCGGTSMEISMVGDNWFKIDRTTKHLIASTAKKIYEPYWDDYFKFSFVRNPWDRMVSMSRYSNFYGCRIEGGKLNVNEYMKRWSNSEIDPRSKSKTENIKPIKNAVYLNILNEELDFIGRFENLLEDFGKVCSILNCKNKLPHSQYNKKTPKRYTEYYNDETQQIVAEKYAKDIEHFGYKFGE